MSEPFNEGIFQPVHVEDDPDPEPVPLQQYFFEETARPSRRAVKPSRPITRHVCRFDERGRHTYMAEQCPHYAIEDENGPRRKPEWTVQDG
jgi:hypothetical protein